MGADGTQEELDVTELASDSEISRYEKAFRETRRVLDESIETLMILLEFEEASARRDDIAAKLLRLRGKRSDLVNANIAFHTGRAIMTPPSRELVAQIAALSKEAVDLTVERATAAAVVRLSTAALKKFAEIQAIDG
jgi:hypothetical protein